MTPIPAALGLLAFGAFFWTFSEYVLHRFAFHEPKGKGLGSREHLRHHADRDYVLEKWYLSWTGVLAASYGLASLGQDLTGAAWGALLGVGFGAAYAFYEYMHTTTHWRAPRTAYGRFVRRHHFHHHFRAPMRNHGVTTSLWDHVFGTYDAVEHVRIPLRMAPLWMLDGDGDGTGEVRPEFAGLYSVVGRPRIGGEVDVEDTRRAFANLAPTA